MYVCECVYVCMYVCVCAGGGGGVCMVVASDLADPDRTTFEFKSGCVRYLTGHTLHACC